MRNFTFISKEGLVFILLLFCAYPAATQQLNLGGYDVILWTEDYPLKWSNFNLTKSKTENYTHSAESCIMILGYPQTIDNKIGMNVINIFIEDKSRQTGEVRSQLLEHEQIHFDIAEYYTRLIRYYLSTMEFKTRMEAQAFVDACIEMYNCAQKLYDAETKHGNNVKMQNEWREVISNNLNAYNNFYRIEFTTEEIKNFEKQLKAKYGIK